jgi:hypothetical protein
VHPSTGLSIYTSVHPSVPSTWLAGMTFPHEPHNGNISCLASCLVELLLACVNRARNCRACLR